MTNYSIYHTFVEFNLIDTETIRAELQRLNTTKHINTHVVCHKCFVVYYVALYGEGDKNACAMWYTRYRDPFDDLLHAIDYTIRFTGCTKRKNREEK